MQPGDPVRFDLDEESYVIGWYEDLLSETGEAIVREVHAFHRLWGGSNIGRGKAHTVPVARLTDCPVAYRHIVLDHPMPVPSKGV